MPTVRKPSPALDSAWAMPATSWSEALERYITFLQVPTWRESVKRGGEEKAACLSATDANALRDKMLLALGRASDGRLLAARPSSKHLSEFWSRRERSTPRSERCPSSLQVHFQRAFLLNAGGYSCAYCHRTAWGVFEEQCQGESPRTLRFEVDHYTTRGRLADRDGFDPKNLVAACRSCNVIKGEMPASRFLSELASLANSTQQIHKKIAR